MSYIVLVRMQSGSLVAITDDGDKLHEFANEDEADTFMHNHILAPLGWMAVEVDA